MILALLLDSIGLANWLCFAIRGGPAALVRLPAPPPSEAYLGHVWHWALPSLRSKVLAACRALLAATHWRLSSWLPTREELAMAFLLEGPVREVVGMTGQSTCSVCQGQAQPLIATAVHRILGICAMMLVRCKSSQDYFSLHTLVGKGWPACPMHRRTELVGMHMAAIDVQLNDLMWHKVHIRPASTHCLCSNTNCLCSNTHDAACCAGTMYGFQQVVWCFGGAKGTPLPTPTFGDVWMASLVAWGAVLFVFRALAARGTAAPSSDGAELFHSIACTLACVTFWLTAAFAVPFVVRGVVHLLFFAPPGAPSPHALFLRARLPVYVLLLALCWESWSQVAWLTWHALKDAG